MEILFYVVYTFLLVRMALSVAGGNFDYVFSPWPGYAFILSTYLLISTACLEYDISDTQWLCYTLAIYGFYVGKMIYDVVYVGKTKKSLYIVGLSDRNASIVHMNFSILCGAYIISTSATLFMWNSYGIPLLAPNIDDARTLYLSNGYVATVASLLDICAIFALAYLVGARGSIRQDNVKRLICVAIIATFVIVAILAGSRSRFLKLLVPGVIIFHFMGRRITIKDLAVLVVVGAVFVGGLGYYRNLERYGVTLAQGIGQGSESWGMVDYVLYFLKQELRNGAYGLDLVIKTIPQSAPYTYGTLHMGPFVMPLKLGIPVPGDYFKASIGGTWSGFGLAATLISPMYADLSVPGVLLFSIIYSFLFSILYYDIFQDKVTYPYSVVMYAVLYYFLISGVRSDILSFELVWFLAVTYFISKSSLKRVGQIPKAVVG